MISNIKKSVPIRTCIVTHIKKPKNELIRIVFTPESKVIVDVLGKAKGRGANITPSLEIFDKAIKKGILEKSLKLLEKLKPDEISVLREQFAAGIAQKSFRRGNKPVTIKVKKEDLSMLNIV
ncbi:MAG TPA: YlxR family protein [Candidatus Dojkabacteria bacterium]|nr:YlxR family protein [Candidatus Dojkabacteria bacterium]